MIAVEQIDRAESLIKGGKLSTHLTYKASKYSVPKKYAYKTVKYMVSGDKLHILDMERNHICSHNLSELRGSY